MSFSTNPVDLVDALLEVLVRSRNASGEDLGITADDLQLVDHKLVNALSTARSLLNRKRAIYRLPPEALARIFDFLKHEPSENIPITWPGTSVPFYHSQERCVGIVASVSQYWRQAALAHPSLWSFISSATHSDYARLCLKRSGETPLTVYLGSCGFPTRLTQLENENFMDELVAHSHRFRELVISRPDFEYDVRILRFFQFAAPLLETLEISFRLTSWTTPELPALFAGQTPKLKRLTLQSFTSWPGNTFTNLTHLSLHGQDQEARPSMPEFLDFLGSSPLLEELIMVHTGVAHDVFLDTDMTLVHHLIPLRRLRSIGFGAWDSVYSARLLLHHLILPPSAEIQIWGNMADPYPIKNLDSICLSHSGTRRDPASITEIRLVTTTRNPFGVEERLFEEFECILNNETCIQFHDRKPQQGITRVMRTPSKTCFTGVRTLWLGGSCGPVSFEEWTAFFRCVPALNSLVLWRGSRDAPLAALTALNQRLKCAEYLLPDLQHLETRGDKYIGVLNLETFVWQRAEHGRRLRSLRITLEGPRRNALPASPGPPAPPVSPDPDDDSLLAISESDVQRLREYVDEVYFEVLDESTTTSPALSHSSVRHTTRERTDWTEFVTSWPPLGHQWHQLHRAGAWN